MCPKSLCSFSFFSLSLVFLQVAKSVSISHHLSVCLTLCIYTLLLLSCPPFSLSLSLSLFFCPKSFKKSAVNLSFSSFFFFSTVYIFVVSSSAVFHCVFYFPFYMVFSSSCSSAQIQLYPSAPWLFSSQTEQAFLVFFSAE